MISVEHGHRRPSRCDATKRQRPPSATQFLFFDAHPEIVGNDDRAWNLLTHDERGVADDEWQRFDDAASGDLLRDEIGERTLVGRNDIDREQRRFRRRRAKRHRAECHRTNVQRFATRYRRQHFRFDDGPRVGTNLATNAFRHFVKDVQPER